VLQTEKLNDMETTVSKKTKEKTTDWINPELTHAVSLEEYRTEMLDIEKSVFISFEDHKKNINQWLTINC
jgi:hypothetical protein